MRGHIPFPTFRLLLPAPSSTLGNAPSITLAGTRWMMTDDMPIRGDRTIDYVCVSYAWGGGRIANPLIPGHEMSDRAIPVIETAIRAVRPTAIWVDAFGMPVHEPARTACLRSMGAIYASAASVVAVLSNRCSALLEDVVHARTLDESALRLLENDEWVSRPWTYQELVNSRSLSFVAEGSSASLPGMQFLSEVSGALVDYKRANNYDSFLLRAMFPRLDNMEDSIADWLTADYAKRSAYQAMSSMDRRKCESADEYFDALIGAISSDRVEEVCDTTLHPSEYFMQCCENKGDFSFIYTSAPRRKSFGRSWRPVAGPLPAIQPWHTFGDGQSGNLGTKGLQLHNMCRMTRGEVGPRATQFITKTFQNPPADILKGIRLAGFTGHGDYIETEEGYFFPQSMSMNMDGAAILVAAGVRWGHGGPGLVAIPDECGSLKVVDVGVFVGVVPQSGDSVELV